MSLCLTVFESFSEFFLEYSARQEDEIYRTIITIETGCSFSTTFHGVERRMKQDI